MKNRKQKVCLILPGLDTGGLENYVLRYLHYLKDVSSITVMSRSLVKGELYEKFESTGVQVHRQQVSYLNPVKWLRLFRFFKREEFTTICDFNENFAGIPMLMATLAGTDNRITYYGRSSHAFVPRWDRFFYAGIMNFLVYTFSTKILSNSRHALDFFFGASKSNNERFKVIANGVQARLFDIDMEKIKSRQALGIPNEVFLVGHSGRYDSAKNHETWFKVAKKLSDKYGDVRFLFCGKDTDGPAFLSRLESHGIAAMSYPLGLVNDVPAVLKAMDLFYFPSVTEGQPNALIEAMLSGIPILSSDIRPIKECLPGHFHHLLINPLDVATAVKRIEESYARGSGYDTCILKSWAREKFDFDKNFKALEDELS